MKSNSRKPFTIILTLLAWFGIISQFYLTLQTPAQTGYSTLKTVVNFFSYFTVLCNLLIAVSLTIYLVKRNNSFWTTLQFQSALALYIFIVGLVYNTILRGIWKPQGLQLITDNILHVAVPLLFVIYWFVYTQRKQLEWKNIFPWLIFPALYFAYSLLRGPSVNWYPYPFLDANKYGYHQVAINSAFVLLAFLVTGLAIIAFNRSGKTAGIVK